MRALRVLSVPLAEVFKREAEEIAGGQYLSRLVSILPLTTTQIQVTTDQVHIFYTEEQVGGQA